MPLGMLATRSVCVVSFAAWVGGFAFYGGVVVPILNDELDHLQAGGITRRVTDVLNGIGVATLAAWWLAAWFERKAGPAWARRVRLGLLGATTSLLAGLFVLHRAMGHRLDVGHLADFYPLHRAYLATSTAQWFANLGWIVTSLVLWTSAASPARPRRPTRP